MQTIKFRWVANPFRRTKPTQTDRVRRTQRRAVLEYLESRIVMSLTMTVTITAAHDIQVTEGIEDNNLTVNYDPATNTYRFTDTATPLNALNIIDNSGDGTDVNSFIGNSGIQVKSDNPYGALSIDQGGGTNLLNLAGENSATTVMGGGGHDEVNIGDGGSTTGILGAVTVDRPSALTDLTIDDSAESADHDVTLTGGAGPITLTTLSPGSITYTLAAAQLAHDRHEPLGNQVLNVDFSGGNPIPTAGSPGLIFNAGADFGDTCQQPRPEPPGHAAVRPFHQRDPQRQRSRPSSPRSASTDRSSSPIPTGSGIEPDQSRLHRHPADQRHDSGDQLHLQRLRRRPVVQRNDRAHRHRLPDSPIRQHAGHAAADLRDDEHRQQDERRVQHPGPTAGLNGLVNITDRLDGLASLTFNTPTGQATTTSRSSTLRPASSPRCSAARMRTSRTSPDREWRPAPSCS